MTKRNAKHNKVKQWLAHKPPKPVQQFAIHHVRPLYAVWKYLLDVNLLVAVGAGELLYDDDPAFHAEMVKLMSTGKTKCKCALFC